MMGDYFSLALGNLKHRGLRSWLTMLGIFIGIAAVVSLISLGQGLQTAITGQFAGLSADILTIQNIGTGFGPPGSTAVRKLNEHDVDIIKSLKDATHVVSRLIRMVSFEYKDVRTFRYAASIPKKQEDVELIYQTMNLRIQSGKLIKADDVGKVVLGNSFADDPELGKDIRVGSNVVIQGKKFEVAGILKPASSFQINFVALMAEDDLKEILKIGDETDIIVVRVEDKNKIEEVGKEIERKLRKDRNEKLGEEDFSVQTPLKALGSVNLILNIINIIVVGIAAISLLVGGIGIANSMFTSVLERTREIGVMKAVGARNSDVLSVFLIEAGLLGLLGGIVGALIGLGMAFGAAAIANQALGSELLKVAVSYPLIFASVVFAFLIGIVSGIIPALQASKLKPTEALRG
ncbi:MAG: ABC transporter permease [Nanoarchaeota archaeon]